MYSFFLDQQQEITLLNEILSDNSGCTIAERAKQYNIPLKIAVKCSKKHIPIKLIEYVQKIYCKKEMDLKKALAFHTKFWNKNAAKYRKILTQLMEQEIPEFHVRLDALCAGTSDWNGTNISINAFDYLSVKHSWYSIVLWETILALTFQQIRKKYTAQIYPDETVWAVSEMTSCAIINTDFNVDWEIGYRQLVPYQKAVFNLYKKKKNFPDFLEEMLLFFKDKNITF